VLHIPLSSGFVEHLSQSIPGERLHNVFGSCDCQADLVIDFEKAGDIGIADSYFVDHRRMTLTASAKLSSRIATSLEPFVHSHSTRRLQSTHAMVNCVP